MPPLLPESASSNERAHSDGTNDLVPEQQHPLYNAGKLYFIERRGGRSFPDHFQILISSLR
jgi:hypothetical protein